VNLTREFLVGELPLPFGPEQAVLEVLETVPVDEEVLAGVARLAAQGYRIALDDFVLDAGHGALLDVASYVKLDLLDADRDRVAAAVAACRRHPRLRLVAERLETDADVRRARDLGFDYFQGYALARPAVASARTLSPTRTNRLQLLAALTGSDVDIQRIVAITASDPALSLRLLRLTNAASSGLNRRVSSVRDAVVLLGLARVRQWVTLMVVADLTAASPQHLEELLVRARLCQGLAERRRLAGEPAYTAGLLSGVAELLDEGGAELAARLPLAEDVRAAVAGDDGPLACVLAAARDYTAGTVPDGSGEGAAREYLAALRWARQVLGSAFTEPADARPRHGAAV
jgi:EAL and modified HD-GYP domain-containing signal transduction protein